MLEFLVASFTIIVMCLVVIYQCDEVEKLELERRILLKKVEVAKMNTVLATVELGNVYNNTVLYHEEAGILMTTHDLIAIGEL